MDEDEYRLQLFPTSSLPKSPAGKLQMVQEMLTAQLISPQQGIRLLNMPDLDQEMSLLNAARDNAFLTAHKLLHEDGPVIPDATLQDLPQCIPIVLAEAIKAFDNGAPEEKIKRCRTWLTQARLALQPPPTPGLPTGVTAPPPGIQVPPPSAGAGVPTPRPVAQLKPQAPLPGAQPAA